MTVRELLERIDSRELAEWMAYAELEPFGPIVDDERYAQSMALAANIAGAKTRADQFRLARPPQRTQDQGQVMAMFQSIARKM